MLLLNFLKGASNHTISVIQLNCMKTLIQNVLAVLLAIILIAFVYNILGFALLIAISDALLWPKIVITSSVFVTSLFLCLQIVKLIEHATQKSNTNNS
jgi:hypothetical protein